MNDQTIFRALENCYGDDHVIAAHLSVSARTYQRWRGAGAFPRQIYREKALSMVVEFASKKDPVTKKGGREPKCPK